MTLTLEELGQRLVAESDEISILELLDIRSQDLVDRFQDKIEAKADFLRREFEEEEREHGEEQED